jgi:hypothetical protein
MDRKETGKGRICSPCSPSRPGRHRAKGKAVSPPLIPDPIRQAPGPASGGGTDPLIAALARYVEALDRRYPGGPDQLRADRLDGRSIITAMPNRRRDPAA